MLLLPRFRGIFQLWHHYQKGHLPVAGGVLDQPAVTMQCLELIDNEMRRIDQEEKPQNDMP
ncbi:MAG: hypothetical protein HQL95_02320 [Magnetococcales bacterium]|nr:hypothetical protein [Magnetococcales bacterium]